MTDEQLVTLKTDGGVARLTINRPEKRNAMNGGVVAALRQRLEALGADNEIRAVVLTGAGAVFSAGADLQAIKDLQTATPMENLEDSNRLAELFETISRLPLPVIARINGHAIAGGCGLAAVCDFSVAVPRAKFGFTEVRIGFVPAIVATFVRRKLSETNVRDLLLGGRLIDAAEAVRIGLITRTVPEEQLDEAVDTIARNLATQTSRSAVAMTKQLLADLPGMSLRESLAYAASMNARARATADCQAGIVAFLDKKPMPWATNS